MSKKSVRSADPPTIDCHRQAAADCINRALEKSDIAEICHAIAAATRLYNISDLAQKSGLSRPNIYRAFAGGKRKPNFTTVLMFSTQWASGCMSRCAGALPQNQRARSKYQWHVRARIAGSILSQDLSVRRTKSYKSTGMWALLARSYPRSNSDFKRVCAYCR